jgi:hypothetical protein
MKTIVLSYLSAAGLITSTLSLPLVGCAEKSDVGEEAQVSKAENAKSQEEAVESKRAEQTGQKNPKKITKTSPEPKGKRQLEKTVQPGVDASIGEKVDEKRNDISDEARAALQETENAFQALSDKKPKEAIEALERVTGKLEILLARKPELSLAPTGVDVVTHDVVGTLDEIERLRDEAADLLEDGEVQKARDILSGLTSEIIIGVTYIPLASFPEAIKAISPLIDQGKMDDAKAALQAAMSTLVVTEQVIPIPILRAEQLLQQAEPLAEKKDRTRDDKQTLQDLLENARYQIKLAKAFGYGEKEDYQRFFDQIEKIAQETSDKKAGKGFFDEVKKSLTEFRESIFGPSPPQA